jgi:sulfur-carrier protein
LKLKIRYFASIREKVGKDIEELDVPAEVATVEALRAHLRGFGANYKTAFSEKTLVRAAVNQDMAQGNAGLKAGDEVAFFPPVTGG